MEYLLVLVALVLLTLFVGKFMQGARATMDDHLKTAVQQITQP